MDFLHVASAKQMMKQNFPHNEFICFQRRECSFINSIWSKTLIAGQYWTKTSSKIQKSYKKIRNLKNIFAKVIPNAWGVNVLNWFDEALSTWLDPFCWMNCSMFYSIDFTISIWLKDISSQVVKSHFQLHINFLIFKHHLNRYEFIQCIMHYVYRCNPNIRTHEIWQIK